MEVGRKCFEITVLIVIGFGLAERSLGSSLQMYFSWTLLVTLTYKVVFVGGFYVKGEVRY